MDWLLENRGWHLPRYDAFPPFAEFLEGYVTPGGPYHTPYERVYGVLSKTNAELPLSDVRTIGEGGMLSTVPDLAQFNDRSHEPGAGRWRPDPRAPDYGPDA